ncbi:hypothetical protein C4J81_17845 [Deltaproteobacteria bacterium Smac51]|nr:hypothetical protein C4J81_17845 [Deltaproteobacteria bacterium Smac51]
MAFTEEQRQAQNEQIDRLKDELSRLNSQFDAQLKTLGMTEAELKAVKMDKLSPELQKALDVAQENAKRAGAERKGQSETQKTSAAPKGRGRAGALKL